MDDSIHNLIKKSGTAASILQKARDRVQAKKLAEEEAKQKHNDIEIADDCTISDIGNPPLDISISKDTQQDGTDLSNSKSRARAMLEKARARAADRAQSGQVTTHFEPNHASSERVIFNQTEKGHVVESSVNRSYGISRTEHEAITARNDIVMTPAIPELPVPSVKTQTQSKYHGKYLATLSTTDNTHNETTLPSHNEPIKFDTKGGSVYGKLPFSVVLLRNLYQYPSLLGGLFDKSSTSWLHQEMTSAVRAQIPCLVSDLGKCNVEDIDNICRLSLQIVDVTTGNLSAQAAMGSAGITQMSGRLFSIVNRHTANAGSAVKEAYRPGLVALLKSVSILLQCCEEQWPCHDGNCHILLSTQLLESVIGVLQNWLDYEDVAQLALKVACCVLTRKDLSSRFASIELHDAVVAVTLCYRQSVSTRLTAFTLLMHLVATERPLVARFMQSKLLDNLVSASSQYDEQMSAVTCAIIGILVEHSDITNCLTNADCYQCVKSLLKRYPADIVREHAFYALSRFSAEDRWKRDISSADVIRECVTSSLRVNARMEGYAQRYAVLGAIAMLAVSSFRCEGVSYGILIDLLCQPYVSPIQEVTCVALHNIITQCLCESSDFEKSNVALLVTDLLGRVLRGHQGQPTRPLIIASICTAVTAIADSNQSCRLQFSNAGLCEMLIDALSIYSDSLCCSHILRAISSLCGTWTESVESCISKFILGNTHTYILSLWRAAMDGNVENHVVADYCMAAGKFCATPQGCDELGDAVVPLALECLNAYGDSADVVVATCRTLSLLARSASYWTTMLEMNFLESACASLSRHVQCEGVVCSSLTAICRMCELGANVASSGSTDIPKLLHMIFERYFSNRTVLMLAHELLSLVIAADDAMDSVVFYTLHRRLIDGLAMLDDKIIIGDLCKSLAATLSHFTQVEILEMSQVLAMAMQTHASDAPTLDILFELGLKLIGTDDGRSIRSAMGDADVCVLAVQLLGKETTTCSSAVKCCVMLEALCHDHDENVARCSHVDVCPILVSTLQRARDCNDGRLASSCSEAICALIANNVNNRISFIFNGLVEVICSCLLHTWTTNEKYICEHLLKVAHLISEGVAVERESQLVEAGLGKAVATVLKNHVTDEAIATAAFATVVNLCSCDIGKAVFSTEGLWRVVEGALSHFENCESALVQVYRAISVLTTWPEIADVFYEQNVYKACANLLKKHITVVSICCDFLNTISLVVDMAPSEEVKLSRQQKWAALGVGPILCEVGNRHIDDVKSFVVVCRTVTSIVENNTVCGLMLVACGACEMITQGITLHTTDSDIAAAGCSALSSLALPDISTKTRIEDCGGCSLVLTALEQHMQNAEVAKQACTAITALCDRCPANAFIFSGKGAHALLTSALDRYITNSSVTGAASCAVAALASGDDGNGVNSENACVAAADALWQAISTADDSAIVASLGIVSSLSDNNIIKQLEFGRMGVCEWLTDLLRLRQGQTGFSEGVLLRPIKSLCHHGHVLTSYVSENVARFVAAGAANMVFLELKKLYASAEVCSYASSILCCFFSWSPDVLESINRIDLCEVIRLALVHHLRNATVTELLCTLMELLICSSDNISASLFTMETVTALVDAFRLHSGKAISEKATYAACKTISLLLETANNSISQYVGSTEFSILLVNIMDEKRSNPLFASLGCVTISRMLTASGASRELLSRFRQLGLCEVLVGVLQIHIAKVDICYNACEAICALSDDCAESQTRFGKLGVCTMLMDLLGRMSTDINFCKIGCQAICTLSSNHMENKLAFGSAGVCSALMRVVQLYFTDAGLIGYAVMALRNLTGCATNIALMRECDTFNIVSTLFLNHITTMDISEHCCAILSNLISGREEYKFEIDNSKVCDACVAALFQEGYHHDAYSMTCLLVANICGGHEGNSKRIIKKGLCEGLIHLMDTHPGDPHFVAMVCTVVSSFSGIDHCLRRCISMGVCRDIILSANRIETFDHAVTNEWCNAITAMATCNSSIVLFLEMGIASKLQYLLDNHSSNTLVVISACRSLIYLSRFEDIRCELTSSGALQLVLRAARENRVDTLVMDVALQFIAGMCLVVDIDDHMGLIEADIGDVLLYAMMQFRNLESITLSCLDIVTRMCSASSRVQKLLSSPELCIQVFNLHECNSTSSNDFIPKYYTTVYVLIRRNDFNIDEFLRAGMLRLVVDELSVLTPDNHVMLTLLCNIVYDVCSVSLSGASDLSNTTIPDKIFSILQKLSIVVPSDDSADTCGSACQVIGAMCKTSSGYAAMGGMGLSNVLVTTLTNYISYPFVCQSAAQAIAVILDCNCEALGEFCHMEVGNKLLAGLQLHIESTDVVVTIMHCIKAISVASGQSDMQHFQDTTKLGTAFQQALELHQNAAIYISICDFIACGGFRRFPTNHTTEFVDVVLKHTNKFLGNTAAVRELCRMICHLSASSDEFSKKLSAGNAVGLLLAAIEQNLTSATTIGVLCRAMTALTVASTTNSKLFGDSGGCDIMLSALRSPDMCPVLLDIGKTVQMYCHCSDNAALFISHGGYDVLLQLLTDQCDSRDVVLGVCYALNGLENSVREHCTVDSTKLHTLLGTIKDIHEHDGEVLASLLCLYSLTAGYDNTQNDVSIQTADALMSSLSANMVDIDLLLQTLRGTIALVQMNAQSAEHMGNNGICDLLCRIIEGHPQPPPELTEELFLATHHLCRQCSTNVVRFRELGMVSLCVQALAPCIQHCTTAYAVCSTLEDVMCTGDFKTDVFTLENIRLINNAVDIFLVSKPDMCRVALHILSMLITRGTTNVVTTTKDIFVETNGISSICRLLKVESISAETVRASFELLYRLGTADYVLPSSFYSKLCPLAVSHMNTFQTNKDVSEYALHVLNQFATTGNRDDLAVTLEGNVCFVCVQALRRFTMQLSIAENASGMMLFMSQMRSYIIQDDTAAIIMDCLQVHGTSSARFAENALELYLVYFQRRDAVFIRRNEFATVLKSVIQEFSNSSVIMELAVSSIVASIALDTDFGDVWGEVKIHDVVVPVLGERDMEGSFASAVCSYFISFLKLSISNSTLLDALGASEMIMDMMKRLRNARYDIILLTVEAVREMCRGNPQIAERFGALGCVDIITPLISSLPHDSTSNTVAIVVETVWLLCENCIRNKESFASGPLPAHLLSVMSEWERDETVAKMCCGAIWHLTLNCSNGRDALYALKATDRIEHVMKIHHKSEEISRLGCGALWALSVSSGSERNKTSSSSLRTLLDTITEHIEDAQVVGVGCVTLANICVDDASALMLGSSGACTTVYSAVKSHRESIAVGIAGCDIISKLSCNGDNSKRFYELGVIQVIYDMCTNNSSDRKVVVSALNAFLSVISGVEARAVELMEFDINSLLMNAFNEYPQYYDIHDSAFRLVCCLLEMIPSSVALFGNSGVCEVATAALQLYTERHGAGHFPPVAITAQVICLLSDDARNVTRLVIAGLFESLEASMKCFSDVKEVSFFAAKVIEIVTDSNVLQRVQYQDALGVCGICEVLVTAMTIHISNADTVLEIIRALVGACLAHSSNISRVDACNGIAAICTVLESYGLTNADVSRTACGLVVVLNANAGCAESCGKLGMCPLVVNAFVAAVQNRDVDAIETICYAMVSLIRGNDMNQIAVGRHNDLGVLMTSVLSGWARASVSAEEAAMWAISLLCKHSHDESSVCSENISKLSTVGCVSTVAATIMRHIEQIDCCRAGVQALCNLSITPDLAVLSHLGEGGCCEAIVVTIRQHISDSSFIEVAVTALANISSHAHNISLLKKMGICDVIVELCQRYESHFDIMVAICRACKFLAVDHECTDMFIHTNFFQYPMALCAEYPAAECGTLVVILECLKAVLRVREGCYSIPCDGVSVVLVSGILEKWIPSQKHDIIHLTCSILKQVLECGSDQSFMGVQLALCKSLQVVFREYSDDSGIVCVACDVARLLSLRSNDCAQYISELGIQDFIVSAMHHMDQHVDVAQTAAVALQTILTDSNTRNDMGLRATCDVVLKSLRRFSDDSVMTEQNCAALLQIANKGLSHVSVLVDMGASELLVSILRKHGHVISLLSQVLQVLECLCKSESAIGFMGSIGICEAVVGAFRRHIGSDMLTTTSFLKIVECLSADTECRITLGLCGSCEIITSILQSATEERYGNLITACARNIRSLSTNNPTNAEAFGMSGVCIALCNAISGNNELSTLDSLLVAIRFLCQQDDAGTMTNQYNTEAFRNSLVSDAFIELFKKCTHSQSTTTMFLLVLHSLASNEDSLKSLFDLGACELVISITKESTGHNDKDFVVSIVSVLGSFAANGCYVPYLLENGVGVYVTKLFENLGDWSDVTVEGCFNIITAFAKHDKTFTEYFYKSGMCHQVVVVMCNRQSLSSSLVVALCAITEVLGTEKYIIYEYENHPTSRLFLDAWKAHDTDSATVVALTRAVLVLMSNPALTSQFLDDGACDVVVKCIRRFMTNTAIVAKAIGISIQIISLTENAGAIEQFFQAGGTDLLLSTLRRYSENPEILAKCCSAFAMLALDDTISTLLGNGGACEGAVNAISMFDNDVRVVQYGCKAIRNLAVLSTNRLLLLSHDATQYIVAGLRRFVHTEKVVIEACAALVNLHVENPESASQVSRILLGSAGDVVKVLNVQVDSVGAMDHVFNLLKILASDDSSREVLGIHDICACIPVALLKHIEVPHVVERGLGAITRISYRNVQNKMLFSESNICEVIMNIYSKYSHNAAMLELCCVATTSLCSSCDKNIDAFVKRGVCATIEEMFTEHGGNMALCGKACQTVSVLCKLDATAKRFDNGNVTKLICQVLQRHIYDSTLVRYACDALRSLGISSAQADQMIETSISTSLVKAVIAFTAVADCMISISVATASLSAVSSSFPSRLGDDGICEALILALEHNKDKSNVAVAIIKALLGLSTSPTNKSRLATSPAYGLIASCMRAFSSNDDFASKCFQLITNVTTSDTSRKHAAMAGVCESISRVFELYEDNQDIVTVAAIATASVSEDNATNADRCAKNKLCLMIFRAIETHMHSSDTVSALLLAVSSLAVTVLNRRFFGGGDGCELVKIALLKNISSPSVCTNAAAAVAAISTDSYENKDAYGKIGMIDILTKNIRNYKELADIVTVSSKTMCTLCIDHSENAERTSRESIAELLVGALRYHTANNEVVEAILKLLVNILQHKQVYAAVLRPLGVRELLVKLVNHHVSNTVTLMYVVRFLRDIYACEEDASSIDPISNECLYLTNALAAHPSDMIIEEDICGIMFLLSRKRLSRSVSLFGDCGACELISNAFRLALTHSNMSLAKMALLALVSLCAGSAANQTKFGDSGACAAVVSILKHMGGASSVVCIDMEGAALNAVAMLIRHGKLKSSENESNIQKLLEEDVCSVVVGCLDKRLDNMPLVYSACRAIFCLASNDSCCDRLIQCGAGDLVARVLQSYQQFPSIAQYAIGAVANLAYTSVGARSLHVHGICDVLIKTLSAHKKDVNIAQHGCNAIKNLSVHDTDIRGALGSAGGCKTLLSLLKAHVESHNVVCPALFAVANMIIDIPVHAEAFMQAQIDQKLFKIVDDNIAVELVCSGAFAVIGNLCDHEFTKQSFIDRNICKLVTRVIKCHVRSDTIVIRCLVSLIRLNGDDASCGILKDDQELCDLVVVILKTHSANEVVVDVACKVLVSLGTTSEFNRCKLVESGAAEQAILILSKNSLDPICAAQVCRAIVFLACDTRSQSLLSELGLCQRVVGMLKAYKHHNELAKLIADAAAALSMNCSSNATDLTQRGVTFELLDSLRSHTADFAVGRSICHALEVIMRHSTITPAAEDVSTTYSLVSVYFQRFWAKSDCSETVCRLIQCLCMSSDFKPIPMDILESLALSFNEYHLVRSMASLCLETSIALITIDKEIPGALGSALFCQNVVSVLRTHVSDISVVSTALKAVSFLSIDQNIRARLGDNGVCEAIAIIFRKHMSVELVLESGLSAVRILASNTATNKMILGDCGFCELIVEVLKFGICSTKQIELALAALANMTNDAKSPNVTALDNAGIITCLVEIFQNHIGCPAIVKQACMLIKHLAADVSGPHKKLGELEMCDKVCLGLAMHIGIDHVNLVLCSCVRALAQDASNRLLLGDCGVCNIVSKVLDLAVENGDVKLLEEVLLTMISLIHGSSANQEAAGRAGICQLIVQIVNGGYGSTIDEKCLWCAAYLCRSGPEGNTTNEENTQVLVNGGLFDDIATCLNEYVDNVNIILPACWALRNACFIETNAAYVLRSSIFGKICSIVQRHVLVLGVCEAACYAISTILSVDQNISVESLGICELVVQVFRRHMNSPSVANRCCSIIANLSSQGYSNRQRLFNEGVCGVVVRALKIHIRLGTVVEEACGAVWNMSMESMESRESFGYEGACEIIVDAIRIHHSNVYVKEAGIGALKALVVDNDYNMKRVQACGVHITNMGDAAVTMKGESESPVLMRE